MEYIVRETQKRSRVSKSLLATGGSRWHDGFRRRRCGAQSMVASSEDGVVQQSVARVSDVSFQGFVVSSVQGNNSHVVVGLEA